ncbi:hypothetical protein CSKR_100358 [Clonorchis sinensis]|uniref:Uncharacterized protein n=2 Tax=Clonorchis sinensis TaxID=79923 RepID=A0A8T1MIY8_CLOSI|nr:hypothetical protein CSKR_100358 [Clonorchis sinensis]GAA50874.1 hypothetical protein CLF_105165 [Clonorchis sinensis]
MKKRSEAAAGVPADNVEAAEFLAASEVPQLLTGSSHVLCDTQTGSGSFNKSAPGSSEYLVGLSTSPLKRFLSTRKRPIGSQCLKMTDNYKSVLTEDAWPNQPEDHDKSSHFGKCPHRSNQSAFLTCGPM